MARTRDPDAHALRRDAFVGVALKLIQSKGYEQMSVSDVLGELDSSRGAFYHYFDSKTALLDAVIERVVDAATDAVAPVVADPELSAPEKLRRVFTGIGNWKTQRRELMEEIMAVWLSDENAIVREHLRERTTARLTPLLTSILEQGHAEGSIAVGPPRATAVVVVSLILAANDVAARLYVANRAGDVPLDQVLEVFGAYAGALERALGLPAGSWPALDPALIRQWFA